MPARGAGSQIWEVRRRAGRVVELAVLDAGAGAHALHVARADGGAVAQAVLVPQFAGEHVGDDLHVAVAVRAETGARRDAVLVDDAQVADAHVARVVIVGRTKLWYDFGQPWSA